METDPRAPSNESPDQDDRVGMGVVGIIFGLIAAWMAWFLNKFLNGNGWFEWIVGWVLYDLALAIGLFSLVQLIGAIFAPRWLTRAFELASHKLIWAIGGFWLLMGAATIGLLIVVPILLWLGVVQ
jgi:hypothetical protein